MPGEVHSTSMVYVHDRTTKKTRLVSKTSTGAPANLDTEHPAMSPNGRFVAFESEATNLPGGSAGNDQVYIHDRRSGKTRLVSKAPDGEPADDHALLPSTRRCVTAGGRFVVFSTFADNFPGSGPAANELVYLFGRLRWPR